jgi:surface protein
MSFTTKEELQDAVHSYINGDRSNGYIHHWDVSRITDMSNLFSDMPSFNEHISNWNVSNVTSMANMFYGCTYFNQDLSRWDVSNVTDMSRMFYQCKNFTGLSKHKKNKWSCISSWNTENVTNMTSMLEGAVIFSAKIRGWDVHNVVYCKDFSKNCCHMRHNLPQFSKHALSLSLLVPLQESSIFELDFNEPIVTPISQPPIPNTTSIQYTNPLHHISSSPINTVVQKISPVKSPVVEYIGTNPPPVRSPDVEYIGTKPPSPDVEYIGTKYPSPDVEYIGTKRPSPNLNFFTISPSPVTSSGGYKRKKTKNKINNKINNKMNKSKKLKKNINDILVTDLAY